MKRESEFTEGDLEEYHRMYFDHGGVPIRQHLFFNNVFRDLKPWMAILEEAAKCRYKCEDILEKHVDCVLIAVTYDDPVFEAFQQLIKEIEKKIENGLNRAGYEKKPASPEAQ